MFIHSIKLVNFLSYGPESGSIELRPLNVLIGVNGSGKSNLLDAFNMLRHVPKQLSKPIREGGGVSEWLWKGGGNLLAEAVIDVVTDNPFHANKKLRYRLSFTAVNQRFELLDERIEDEKPLGNATEPYFYYRFQNGQPVVQVGEGRKHSLKNIGIDREKSILAQRKDPEQYPELTHLADFFERCQLYREWSFGRNAPVRMPQKADLPNDFLSEDCSNLGLVLNRIRQAPDAKRTLLKALSVLFEGIEDFDVSIEGSTTQVCLQENGIIIPAPRLSDGTLRYLCLLAVLCHPKPPPLVCIEEPELGLHPDVLPTVAGLLQEASTRCQLVVTTHSDILIDALSEQPESVLVSEKTAGGTMLTRLDAEHLKPWLEKYRLGELWTRGELGGTRW